MNRKNVSAVILCTLFFLVFLAVLANGMPSWPATIPSATSVGAALWKGRTLEVLAMGFIILAGVVSILLLLGPDRPRGLQP